MSVDWMSLLQTFGVAVVVLVFCAWCLVGVARWAAPRIDKAVERIFRGLDKVETFESRVSKAEGRIDVLWDMTMRHATVEALERGLIDQHGSVRAAPKKWVDPIAAELQSYYRAHGTGLTDSQLSEEVEKRWGEWLLQTVCVPHRMTKSAALLLAIAVAKEESS